MLNRAVPGNLLPRKFTAGFSLELLLKDLDLGVGFADELGVSASMATVARKIYEEGMRHGLAKSDMTAAVLPMEQRHGIEIKANEG
jgi:3-hydroxyisobutyrate dehydrogenase-like beta-hydroxyacid dehydrogenase